MKAILAIALLVAIVSAQAPQPAPADFPNGSNFPQNAGGTLGTANPYTNQYQLANANNPYGTGYTGGLGGAWPGQQIGGVDPVRGVVLTPYSTQGSSSASVTGRSGRGAASGNGFQSEDLKAYREQVSTSAFIAPLHVVNPPGQGVSSGSMVIPSVLAILIALIALFF